MADTSLLDTLSSTREQLRALTIRADDETRDDQIVNYLTEAMLLVGCAAERAATCACESDSGGDETEQG